MVRLDLLLRRLMFDGQGRVRLNDRLQHSEKIFDWSRQRSRMSVHDLQRFFLVELDLKREFLSMNCLVGKDLGRWPALENFYLFSFVNCSSLKNSRSTWRPCSTILCQQRVISSLSPLSFSSGCCRWSVYCTNVCCNLYKPW